MRVLVAALVAATVLAAPVAVKAATERTKLTASDGAAFDVFGVSVAVHGDTMVVGATDDDVGANSDQGSAYVFTRRGQSWSERVKLTASDGAASDFFGDSVAIHGDTAVVGAPGDDVGADDNQGSAYVFTRQGQSWTERAKLTASDGAEFDQLGFSVAVHGDTAVVGAWLDDRQRGSAYVFTRQGQSWTERAKLTASDGAAFDLFGSSVAVHGDTAVIGALFDDAEANSNQGSAYVFTRQGHSWSERAKLTASDGAVLDRFGSSVALHGDTALVGAYLDDVGVNGRQGSAYVFTRGGQSWSERAKLTASDGAAGDWFGLSVAVHGDTAVVGAPFDDVRANVMQGSAYVFGGLYQ